jgi:3-phosphoshikimate 1-carboxyvinyltransferase
MQERVLAGKRVRGTISPPADKSISHRAAMLNAIADGEALVENFLRSADTMATLACLRKLGVAWSLDDAGTLRIRGSGREGLREANGVLDCRNSGTSIRLFAGLLAAQPFLSVLTGDASLRSRPMSRVVEPLRKMGARVWGREGDTKAPLVLNGGDLNGMTYRLPVASAQVKSAVLLAGLFAEGETAVEELEPTRDHTERMLRSMGAEVRYGEGPFVSVGRLNTGLSALSLRVPGDVSSAAPWLVLGSIHPDAEIRLQGVCVNPTRTGILDALAMMGADIRLEEERTWGAEPVADLVVRSSRLRGAEFGGALIPRAIDELPLLALAACFAEEETVIRDAGELRLKESDRIKTTVAGLRRMGAKVEAMEDGMRITGPQRLSGASVSSYGDHRLATMLGVAGAVADKETIVRGSSSVAVSYPRFWEDLRQVSMRR